MRTSTQTSSSRAAEITEASHGRRFSRWQTCNKSKCIGQDHPTKPHHPNDCYHNPDNVNKMEEWKKAKQRAGEWVEYPRGGGHRGRGRPQLSNIVRGHGQFLSSNFPRSEDLEASFSNLRLEDRNVSYHLEFHGK